MQIERIKIADYIKTGDDATVNNTRTTVDEKDTKVKPKELATIKVDNASYDKKGKRTDDAEEIKNQLEGTANLGANTIEDVKNLSKNIDEETVQRLEDDGFDPMDVDANTIVTVADEIKMTLAKAGVDISKMGGLSSNEIEKMTGSVTQAVQLAGGIDETLSDEVKKYLVVNDLEPTIENLYNASYSAPTNGYSLTNEMSDEELVDLLTKLSDKLDELIDEAEGATKELAGRMFQQDIPVTKDSLEYMAKLDSFTKPDEEQVLQAIDDIVKEGLEPKDAYLIEGYSLMDQAREAVEEVSAIDINTITDIKARRQLEEIRMEMTVEATFVMLKNGVDVDTTNLSKLIEDLKAQENNLLNILLKSEKGEPTGLDTSLFKETLNAVADIESSPIYGLGRFSNISQATLSEIHTVSVSVKAEFTRMEMTYEAVGTEVRRDLGDNISKAFSNVDDILSDLGLDDNESNEKAVRILAYNQLEINVESVTTMKQASEMVGRTFKNMTPAVVSEMIKQGKNPLDMTMSQLKEETEGIKAELSGNSDSESFSKFLWKMEHTEGISEEERAGYIGIYRLLNQVEKSDGAAIGALIAQGSEITMRNLMTAVRSQRHSGKEYEVSDKVGAVSELISKDLSITQQIEKAFMTDRCRDAKEAMTPEKMQTLGEELIMSMNPDEFATAMETGDDSLKEAYNQNLVEQIKEAVEAQESVYRIIEEFNLPTTANIVSAVTAMLADNNKAVRDLYKKAADQQDMTIEDLIDMAYERFAQACENPEEMAEAEEALGVLAENVMKTMIDTEDVKTIDLDGMKLIIQEAKAYGQMAKENELFHIPIMVADEAGTMNLKIVRGSNESGLVQMALHLQNTGTIASTMKYEKDMVDVQIECETKEMREAFAAEAPIIAQTMQEETGFSFSFSFGQKSSLSVNDIYNMENGNYIEKNSTLESEQEEIQTKALYGIARSFIRVMGEMFS